MDHLPFVLLGLRTSVREDSACSPSDLLYGSPLRLPGDLLDVPHPAPAVSDFGRHLRSVLGSSTPMPVVYHREVPSSLHPALYTASHVFVRVDAVKRPLVPPYDGPFLVLERAPKFFKILRNQKPVSVSVDRLKPASFLPAQDPDPPSGPRPDPLPSRPPPGPPPPGPSSAAAPLDPVPVGPPLTDESRPSSLDSAESLDPEVWPLPTRYGRRPRPPARLNL